MTTAYWWRGSDFKNLGDELTTVILREKFGLTDNWASLKDADVAATGSLLGWVWEKDEIASRQRPLQIVGSGFMDASTKLRPLEFLNIHSVRGYLSKTMLGSLTDGKTTVGDPGLLISNFINPRCSNIEQARIGVILHHSKSLDSGVRKKFDAINPKFIDIRTGDVQAFVSELCSCDFILSQSLHGLVLADSFGIPNAWLDLGPLHRSSYFKFFDYFSAIGRPFYEQVRGIPESENEIKRALFRIDTIRLSELKNDIVNAFERALELYE